MDRHHSNLRRLFLTVTAGILFGSTYAQQQELFKEYQKAAGEKAMLFSGKAVQDYATHLYDNTPFWEETGKFQSGSVMYDGNLYTDVHLRYDTYTRILAVNTPENGYAIQVEMQLVDYFVLDGIRFIRQEGEDFCAVVYESPRIQLLQQAVTRQGTDVVKERVSYKHFNRNFRFTLVREGVKHTVSSRSSVLKLFPQHKKALKAYANKAQLNFRRQRAEALTALVKYADELTANATQP